VPGFGHAVAGAFGGDGQPVKLAGKAHGEVADVDHLLHFAKAFGGDLADLQCHEGAKVGLGGAKFFAEEADEFAPPRGGDGAPLGEGGFGAGDDGGHLGGGGFVDPRELGAVDGGADGEGASGQVGRAQACGGKCGGMGHVLAPSWVARAR